MPANSASAVVSLENLPWHRRVALGATMFFTTGAVGFLQPFTSPYLQAAGLSRFEINLVQGLATLTGLLIQPVIGRLSDRWDARRPMMLVAAVVAGLAYWTFPVVPMHATLFFLLLLIVGANGFQYLNSAGGVLIGRLAGAARGGSAYARYRVWGSVGYVAVTLTTGWLLPQRPGMARADLGPVYVWGPLLFLAIALLSWRIPDATVAATRQADHEQADQGDPENLKRFLVAFTLYQSALYGASANLSLYLKEVLHATPRDLSYFFAAGVIMEVVVMTQVGRWTDRHGRKPALMLAFFLMPLRLACYIPAISPLWATVVQTLHGLNFGIVGAIAVAFVNDCAKESERGAAQAKLAATAAVATALGQWVCGVILQRFGYPAMFGSMAVLGALGALVLLTRVHESHPDLRPHRAK